MDNKITLSILAQLLSDRTGRSRKECEDLLRGFFQTISATLSKGEAVKVRGFGTFRISQVDARMSVDISSGQDFEIPAHNRIVFLPSKELAAAVNAPFSMFETIELAEELSEVDLQDVENEADAEKPEVPGLGDELPHVIDPAAEYVAEPVSEDLAKVADEVVTEPVSEEITEPVNEGVAGLLNNEEDEIPCDEPELDSVYERKENRRGRSFSHGFVWGMVASVLLICGGLLIYYFLNPEFAARVKGFIPGHNSTAVIADNRPGTVSDLQTKGERSKETEELIYAVAAEQEAEDADANESAEENPVPTKPSDETVFDTILPHSGLGVMARKHYGNYHFWPYIYKENEKILGHPDRITPGTKVVIPKLSKYGIDPKNKDDLAKAKRLDAEIYAKYRKH